MGIKSQFIRLSPPNRLHKLSVPVIGLTGGIATGKSEVSKRLVGQPIIDADANVKSIYATPESFEFISNNFPNAITDDAINFKILRETAFSDPQKKEIIENYIYQRLPQKFMDVYHALGNPDYVIYDVPLLFEKNLDKLVDIKITVYCPRTIQIERLLKRDGISLELANKILDAQWDIEKKKEQSDFIIDNSSTLKALDQNIKDIFSQILI